MTSPHYLLLCCLLLSTHGLYAQQKADDRAIVPGHNLFANRFNALWRAFPEADGRGIVVSIKEDRFDTTDVDLRGRILPSPNAGPPGDAHPTLMATLVGGAGTSSPRAKGGAPGCMLLSSRLDALAPDAPEQYARLGVSVQNHSYGIVTEHDYNAAAQAYDRSVALRPTLTHVFSAGNMGLAKAVPGPYGALTGYANLTGSFKTAKNALVVGATDSFQRVWSISSRGPTRDGRLKPDLAAFGQGGSSDAAALTSAAAAVLQQMLRARLDSLPSAALVRALLFAGAQDIGLPGPDFESGFGALDVHQSAEMAAQGHYRQGSLTNDRRRAFPLTIPAGTGELRIVLTWDDPPGDGGTNKALVNDLDLWLTDPDGRVYRPWVKPHAPDSVAVPARRGVDTLNNAELVSILAPKPGLWTIWVGAGGLSTPSQPFAFAFHTPQAETFHWTCPAKGDALTAGKDASLYWTKTPDITGKGVIEWRAAGQNIWRRVSQDSAVLSEGMQRWRLPDAFAAAQVRMRTGGKTYVSDTFLIAPELRVQVGLNCPDSLLLFWNRVAPKGYSPAPSVGATDGALWQGANRYRAVIYLGGSRTLVSDVVSLFHAGTPPKTLFFPVPFTASGGDLYWIPDSPLDGAETLQLFDAPGRMVAEATITASEPAFFRLPALLSGIYYYKLSRPGRSPVAGVLAVLN